MKVASLLGVTGDTLGGGFCLVLLCFTDAFRAGDVAARCLSSLFFCHHCVTRQSAQAFSCFMMKTSGERSASHCTSPVALATDLLIVLFRPLLVLWPLFSHLLTVSLCDRLCTAASKKITLSRIDALLLARLFLKNVLLGLRHFNSTSSTLTLWLAEV